MNIKIRELSAPAIGLGVVFAIGAGVYWTTDHANVTDQQVTVTPNHLEEASEPRTNADVEALAAELELLKSERANREYDSADVEDQLGELRAQLAKLNQDQEAIARYVDGMDVAGISNVESQFTETGDEPSSLTPEEEAEQFEAEAEAQAESIVETVFAEAIDPEWAVSAEVVLDNAFQSSEANGINLVAAECKTSACRLELNLDDGLPAEEGFRKLAQLTPWQGQAFVQVDDDGSAIMFLAREGYSLVTE